MADLGSQNIDYCYVLFQIIVFEEQKADDKILFAESPDHGKTIDVYKLPFCTLLWKICCYSDNTDSDTWLLAFIVDVLKLDLFAMIFSIAIVQLYGYLFIFHWEL